MAPPRKYTPLLDILAAVPAAQAAVTFTLTELEALLGQPLPHSARHLPAYWTHSVPAHANWLAMGFSARLDRTRATVTFTRRPAAEPSVPA